MRFATVLFLSLVISASGASTRAASQQSKPKPTAERPAASRKTTNQDVLDMIAAGLSDQLISSAVQRGGSTAFDLSPAGLVQLKKGGASDALIHFLLTGEIPAASAAATPPAAATPLAASTVSGANSATPAATIALVPPPVATDDGVYYLNGDTVHRIEAKTPYQTRTGSKAVSRLTLGIKKARLNAKLLGLTADVQFSESPKFYVHLEEDESIGEYYLVRFTPKQGNRELEVASSGLGKAQAGFPEKDIFLIDYERLDKNIFIVRSKLALPGGEYSLLVVPQALGSAQSGLTPRKLFDFGVR